MGGGGREGGSSWKRRVGKPAVVTASFLPYFRNEIRESGSIYGNIGSGPSLFCPLESFKWFLRNLFPRRDDSRSSLSKAIEGHSLAPGCGYLPDVAPEESVRKQVLRPSVLFVPLPVPREREWRHDPGKVSTYLG